MLLSGAVGWKGSAVESVAKAAAIDPAPGSTHTDAEPVLILICPLARAGGVGRGRSGVMCGLIIEQRTYHQVTGEAMKFLTLCDGTGMVETELFAATYRSYGLATVRYPVLEISATV